MEIIQTPIQGVLLVKPKVWGDSRGYFVETWHKERYETAGIDFPFVQDNHSKSSYGIPVSYTHLTLPTTERV